MNTAKKTAKQPPTNLTVVPPSIALSVFANAPSINKKKSGKTDKKEVEIGKQYEKNIKEGKEIKRQIDDLKGRLEAVQGPALTAATNKFLDLYEESKMKPGSSIKIVAGNQKTTFIVMDKYNNVTEEQMAGLPELLEDCPNAADCMEEVTSYVFNPDIFKRHKDAIERAIGTAVAGMTELSDYEKQNLFLRDTKISIRKGTINNLLSFGKNFRQVFDFMNVVKFFKHGND